MSHADDEKLLCIIALIRKCEQSLRSNNSSEMATFSRVQLLQFAQMHIYSITSSRSIANCNITIMIVCTLHNISNIISNVIFLSTY